MTRLCTIAVALGIVVFAVSCGDSTGPEASGEPVLSAGEVSHFHCELSWTQVDLESQEHISYNLYKSASTGISQDTTQAELIATFENADDLEYNDSLLSADSNYYFALLTEVTESGTDASEFIWSNEILVASDEVNYVSFINNSGHTMYFIVQQGGWSGHPEAGPWLSNIGSQSKWTADNTFSSSYVESCSTGATLNFIYPEFDITNPHGARIYFGEAEFTGAPDLNTYPHIYDKMEAGWGIGNTWNTTCVGFIAIPIQMAGKGKVVGFNSNVTRSALFDSLGALPSPYGDLAFPSSGDPVRFFSPGKYPDQSVVASCLDSALALGLPLAVQHDWSYGGDDYTDVTFTPPDEVSAQYNGSTSTATDINTAHVFACNIPNSGDGGPRLAALIGAAASRGVLHNYDWWADSTKYYQVYSENAGQYNYYSALLHHLSLDGLCYGMPYDDYYNQDSGIGMDPGDSITVTILPFN
ncbi:MAG: hypothetical protein KAR44_07590 [Candidatus Aegiribacteria sp.]|nr:hypothetical protein [Candidatus Aegiribacteria sp.]